MYIVRRLSKTVGELDGEQNWEQKPQPFLSSDVWKMEEKNTRQTYEYASMNTIGLFEWNKRPDNADEGVELRAIRAKPVHSAWIFLIPLVIRESRHTVCPPRRLCSVKLERIRKSFWLEASMNEFLYKIGSTYFKKYETKFQASNWNSYLENNLVTRNVFLVVRTYKWKCWKIQKSCKENNPKFEEKKTTFFFSKSKLMWISCSAENTMNLLI